jgi:arylsulfotransferase ASST
MAERAGPLGGIARTPRRFRVVAAALAVGLVALGLAACQPVKGPVTPPQISTNPALFPGFQTGVADYVNRCVPNTPTDVNVNAPDGTTVSVNGSPPASGQFSVQVAQGVGARFTIIVTTNGNSTTHYVRCLPSDFPNWSVEKTGPTQAQFYAAVLFEGFVQPRYSVVFDSNGVPIWWLPRSPAFLLQPLSNNNFATMNISGGMQEYDLNGNVVRSLNTVGADADFHDVVRLPNGNYVMATAQNAPCNLSSWGLGVAETCIDHVFQEINPAAPTVPVWSWDTASHIPVTETADAWIAQQTSQTRTAYDPYHYNSVEYTGDGFILSFRHLDAVYKVDHTAQGTIQWKLGGKPRNESLTIQGDALGGPDSQHDARLLPDGTVTLHDNGTNGLGPSRPPRAVRYLIDTQAKTATFIGQLTDADVPTSGCCGSTRTLPGGDTVIGWGGTPQISEYAPDGSRIFRILGGTSVTVYRGTPIVPGVFTADQFRNGMDAQATTASSAHQAQAPANIANSPLGTTLASMLCCLK